MSYIQIDRLSNLRVKFLQFMNNISSAQTVEYFLVCKLPTCTLKNETRRTFFFQKSITFFRNYGSVV